MALAFERQGKVSIPIFFVGGRRSRIFAYLLAVGLTIATLCLRLVMWDLFGSNPTLLIFTVPIILSAYFGGLGPGLLATAVTLIAATYYILPPLQSFAIHDVASIWQQAIVLTTGTLVSVICELLHRSRVSAVNVIDQLRRSEERLQAMTDNLSEGILLANLQGQILHWNPAGVKMFGFSDLEEGLHQIPYFKSVFELTTMEGKHIPFEQWPIARVIAGETLRDFESVIRRLNGSWERVFSYSGSQIVQPDGETWALLTITDVTERRKADLALRESEARFSTSFRASPMPIVISRLSDRTSIEVNDAFLQTFECKREDIIGQTMLSSGLGDALSVQKLRSELSSQGGLKDAEMTARTRTGKPLHLSLSTRLIEVGGQQCALSILVDMTARNAAEQEIVRLNNELEERVVERTAQLETANRELEAFSYSISHDLRSPLRSIDGFSQALIEDYGPTLPNEAQGYLTMVRGGAQKMGQLIDDLLRFSRLSRAPVGFQKIDTGLMVRDTLDDVSLQSEARSINIITDELPPCEGDAALIKQVWLNLISNAFKYTSKTTNPRVHIGCIREAGKPDIFFVKDNGTGFDMRYADKLFGVFQRLHRMEDFEGTGVGLAIVQRIIHRHGGNIWADAQLGKGATFSFTLRGD